MGLCQPQITLSLNTQLSGWVPTRLSSWGEKSHWQITRPCSVQCKCGPSSSQSKLQSCCFAVGGARRSRHFFCPGLAPGRAMCSEPSRPKPSRPASSWEHGSTAIRRLPGPMGGKSQSSSWEQAPQASPWRCGCPVMVGILAAGTCLVCHRTPAAALLRTCVSC